MTDGDWRWPTSEEWEAVLSLSKNGDIKPIIDLLRLQAPNVHRVIYDTLEELDHWDNSTQWIISKTPKGSLPKPKTVGQFRGLNREQLSLAQGHPNFCPARGSPVPDVNRRVKTRQNRDYPHIRFVFGVCAGLICIQK